MLGAILQYMVSASFSCFLYMVGKGIRLIGAGKAGKPGYKAIYSDSKSLDLKTRNFILVTAEIQQTPLTSKQPGTKPTRPSPDTPEKHSASGCQGFSHCQLTKPRDLRHCIRWDTEKPQADYPSGPQS